MAEPRVSPDDQPDLNTGKEWSEEDLLELAITVRMKNSLEFIATFLRRSSCEVRDKIAELEQSGELARLIKRVEAFIAIHCGFLRNAEPIVATAAPRPRSN